MVPSVIRDLMVILLIHTNILTHLHLYIKFYVVKSIFYCNIICFRRDDFSDIRNDPLCTIFPGLRGSGNVFPDRCDRVQPGNKDCP